MSWSLRYEITTRFSVGLSSSWCYLTIVLFLLKVNLFHNCLCYIPGRRLVISNHRHSFHRYIPGRLRHHDDNTITKRLHLQTFRSSKNSRIEIIPQSSPKNNINITLPIRNDEDYHYINNNGRVSCRNNIDDIMSKLCNPAPQSMNVIHTAMERLLEESLRHENDISTEEANNELTKDDIINGLSFLVKPGYRLNITTSSSSSSSSSTITKSSSNNTGVMILEWDVVPESSSNTTHNHNHRKVVSSETSLQLAHKALELVTNCSRMNIPVNETQLNDIVYQLEKRLTLTKGTDLRGRKSTDAAFTLSLAGITTTTTTSSSSSSIYDALLSIAISEVSRFGSRSSCRKKDIRHMMEKLGASGVRPGFDRMGDIFYDVARECLKKKKKGEDDDDDDVRWDDDDDDDYGYGFGSVRVLLWLWRFSSRQGKKRAEVITTGSGGGLDEKTMTTDDDDDEQRITDNSIIAANDGDDDDDVWINMFHDPTKPLIVDLGCGMGVSLLGLASSNNVTTCRNDNNNHDISSSSSSMTNITWSDCNFIGCDLNALFIRYANGIASRWGLRHKNLAFVVSSADDFLRRITESYPGPVSLLMIQFPTPFRRGGGEEGTDDDDTKKDRGNAQLPSLPSSNDNNSSSSSSGGFMVTNELLQQASHLLQSKRQHDGRSTNGCLLLQSNCEDVAVTMKNMAIDNAAFEAIVVPRAVRSSGTSSSSSSSTSRATSSHHRLPKRTKEWIESGGERAIGPIWSEEPLLPSCGVTETDVACRFDGTPVHRCLLQPRNEIGEVYKI